MNEERTQDPTTEMPEGEGEGRERRRSREYRVSGLADLLPDWVLPAIETDPSSFGMPSWKNCCVRVFRCPGNWLCRRIGLARVGGRLPGAAIRPIARPGMR